MMFVTGLLLLFDAPLQADEAKTLAAADAIQHDLSTWSFSSQGHYRIDNNWLAYRDVLVDPEDFSPTNCSLVDHQSSPQPEVVGMPDIWGPALTRTTKTGHGKTTYCTSITLPDDKTFYAVRVGTTRTVATIFARYIDAHDQPASVKLYQNKNSTDPRPDLANNPAPPLIPLPYGIKRVSLIIQLQNSIHKQGGMIEVPVLDLKWRLDARQNRDTALPNALVIVLLMVSIGTFLVGTRHQHSLGHKLFAALTLASALRVLFVSDIIWDYFPDFPLERKYDLEYLTLFMIAPIYYAFISFLLRERIFRKQDFILYGISACLCVYAIVFAPFQPPGNITLLREPVQLLWALIGVEVTYMLFSAYVRKKHRNKEAVLVASAALAIIVYEILSASGTIEASLEWSQFLVVLVTLMHMRAFVINSRRIERERDALMEDLKTANSELQSRANALDLALVRAESASRAKSDFLATMSHELRTPLNAIIGFSELMIRQLFGPLGNKHYLDYSKDINESGTHLLSLVNDILDLSRIEAGSETLEESNVNIEAVAASVLKLTSPHAEERHIQRSIEKSQNLPHIIGDERKIRQVFFNLVTNAIKFNKEGGSISIAIFADELALYVEVRDTGIGMDEKDIPRALERFGQISSNLNRTHDGLGIGLPLCQAIVRQHGGQLVVSSTVGKGTTVQVRFPASRFV
jgi:signal transduction histidine kinase